MGTITLAGDIVHMNSGIICHQVNCRGVMGAGLARNIREEYPKVYKDYMLAYQAGHLQLGNVVISKIKKHLYIASICGQNDYGRNVSNQYTDYKAITEGLERVQKFSNDNKVCPIYVPHHMGCGLGGGEWHMILNCIHMATTNTIIVQKF